jgi:hypothetical protein
MGSGKFRCSMIGILALTAAACARKDRVAPCAPGEGFVASYVAFEPATPQPFVVSAAGGEPCGPLRRLNGAPLASSAKE